MAVEYWNHITVVRFAFLTCIFIISCCVVNYRRLRYILTTAGTLQAFIAFGQLLKVVPTRHTLFPVTGFMENPGQMGGFQAVALICCLSLMKERRTIFTVVLVLFLSGSLYLSDSRAGLVAAITGSAFIYRHELQGVLKQRKYLLLVCLAVTALFVTGLYFYRSGSVDARLLVWRVSLDMIADRPLTGFGPGNFPFLYMLYQADYFMHHPESRFCTVADNVFYPFNEYIKLAVESGLPGLVIFVAAMYLLWRFSENRDAFAPLVALLVFGFFSYPSDKLVLASLLPLSAGAMLYDNVAFIPVRTRLVTASVTAIVSVWIYSASGIGDPDKNLAVIPTCEAWCDIGEDLEQKGYSSQAEKYYQTASYMIPTRIRPKYLLWRLYISNGRDEKAYDTAQEILSMPLKIENTFTLRVKDEIRQWYYHLSEDLSPEIYSNHICFFDMV